MLDSDIGSTTLMEMFSPSVEVTALFSCTRQCVRLIFSMCISAFDESCILSAPFGDGCVVAPIVSRERAGAPQAQEVI